ncbi:TetR/AcrR family transcriptional regulator [Amycolatopsis regifaucium]|uniref:Transcriptional regulator n=1 Tax=Amycolatopsis regifaucium TaxID=546365 RepID=A0A154MGW3_9PSEU|nr:transcriptional regulator [Amycolatopsis regifaucium]OKA03846.1 TetR family transcriptional regulator [Amycolatopsis regifaucium]SFJ66320.1 DNA-binding transcriptional regulator, AcrR family [Amycolatopsis regifaucium]
MRVRLLDATIDCLVEYGYAGTTTTRVADRAGVTRGAQVHHFPTKADLVTSAIRHLAAKRTEVAMAEIDRLKASADPVGDALQLMWEMHQGPVFSATVELWVASRTDPELRAQMAVVEPIATSSLVEFGKALLPDHAAHPEFLHAVYTAMDVVRGILIASWATRDQGELEARWDRGRRHLILLFEALMQPSPSR